MMIIDWIASVCGCGSRAPDARLQNSTGERPDVRSTTAAVHNSTRSAFTAVATTVPPPVADNPVYSAIATFLGRGVLHFELSTGQKYFALVDDSSSIIIERDGHRIEVARNNPATLSKDDKKIYEALEAIVTAGRAYAREAVLVESQPTLSITTADLATLSGVLSEKARNAISDPTRALREVYFKLEGEAYYIWYNLDLGCINLQHTKCYNAKVQNYKLGLNIEPTLGRIESVWLNGVKTQSKQVPAGYQRVLRQAYVVSLKSLESS